MDPSHLQPHSCKHCQRLVLDMPGLVAKKAEGREQLIVFDFTLWDLEHAACDSCSFCKWILEANDKERLRDNLVCKLASLEDGVTRNECYDTLPWSSDDSDEDHYSLHDPQSMIDHVERVQRSLAFCMLVDRASTNPPSKDPESLDLVDLGRIGDFGLWDKICERSISFNGDECNGGSFRYLYRYHDDAFLRFSVTSDNVAAKFVSTRPITAEAACKENFQLARKWFKQCQESHNSCFPPSIDFMPKRLIEIARGNRLENIGGRWSLRLHHPNKCKEPIEPYVALSYCWGQDQHFKLTRGTINSMSNEIIWQDLPQTIKDAIFVTQELHIRFLWIDSLCIVQDDAEEMSTEITQMPKIYSFAAVTILASRASNVQEGFLQNRQITKSPDLVFELPYRCLTGELGSVIASFPPADMRTEEPLEKRAWAVQERLLSPRVLEYTRSQLRWVCRRSRGGGKEFVDGWIAGARLFDSLENGPLDLDAIKTDEFAVRQYRGNAENLGIIQHWDNLVNDYTCKTLTFPINRMLAISALASEFGRVLGDLYLAGMWKCEFPACLLWVIYIPGQHRRPRQYQGPSWSWTGVNGSIKMFYAGRFVNAKHFELVGNQIELTNDLAPYGSLEYGYLMIRCRLKRGELTHHLGRIEMDPSTVEGNIIKELAVSNGLLPRASYIFDAIEDEFDDENITSIPVYLSELGSRGDGGLLGLILRKLGDSQFSRLGTFEFMSIGRAEEKFHSHWFDGCEPQIITLV